MDDTTRGVGDEALRGRAAEPARPARPTPGPEGVPDRPAAGGASSAPREGASSTAGDEDSDRRARELRADIEQTRDDMSETIDAIQERLRPGNIVSEAKERVKGATTERVRHMIGSASETAQGAMDRTRDYAGNLRERTGSTAIPLMMIGAGVTWLVVDRLRGSDRGRDYGYRAGGARRYGEPDEIYRTTESRDLDEPYYETEYDWNRGRMHEGGAGMRRMSSRAGHAASRARERAMRAGRRTTSGVQRMIRDNPLLVGLAAMMLGAALGMALPETERENELMGETRENVLEKAQDVARGAASRAQEAIGDAAGEVASRVVTGKDKTQT